MASASLSILREPPRGNSLCPSVGGIGKGGDLYDSGQESGEVS